MSDKNEYYTNAEAMKITGVSIAQLRNFFLLKGLSRPKGLWPANIIDAYAAARRRTKLAAKIGYKSTRHLTENCETVCDCGSFAVLWDGRTICENGHIIIHEFDKTRKDNFHNGQG